MSTQIFLYNNRRFLSEAFKKEDMEDDELYFDVSFIQRNTNNEIMALCILFNLRYYISIYHKPHTIFRKTQSQGQK